MVEDQGKKEEFDFTNEGETLGYVSLAQARLLAMQTARNTPGNYGSQYDNVSMVFAVTESGEDEDYYTVILSFRPENRFIGTPGQEQFFISKEGEVVLRQILNSPSARGRWRQIIVIASGVAAIAAVALVATIIFGSKPEPFVAQSPLPPVTTVPTSTEVPMAAIVPSAAGLGRTSAPIATATPSSKGQAAPAGPTTISSGMRRGASISGRVTDAETGLPIANMEFGAELGPQLGRDRPNDISEARTDDDGNYAFRGLPTGLIRFHVHDRQHYIVRGGDIWTGTVGAGEELEGADFSFKLGTTISGQVTDTETGLPIAGVDMRAKADQRGPPDSRDETAADGRYTLDGLAPGSYVILAEGETGYIGELYDDQKAWEDANRVVVTETKPVEGIDFGLNRGATISGRVVDAETGLPIANMDVTAILPNGSNISRSKTQRDGRYTLKGIPDGVIEVVVAGQNYVQTIKAVTIRDGQDVTGFDF